MEKNQFLNSSFWQSQETHILLNPRLSPIDRQSFLRSEAHHALRGAIGLQSSGTESSQNHQLKLVVFDRESILTAARSVNQVYAIDSTDIWMSSLPIFHIGGLSIYARVYLAGCWVVEFWSQQKRNSHNS